MDYRITASLRFPSSKAEETDFRDLQSDFETAANVFNSSNAGKSISSVQCFKNMFQFILTTEHEPKSIGHELSGFSRFLYNKLGWDVYTRVPTKLFQYQSELLQNETHSELDQKVEIDASTKTILIPKSLIIEGYNIKFI